MADNASRDQNFVPSLLAVSSSDGTTTIKVYADPSTHRLLVTNSGQTITTSVLNFVQTNKGTIGTGTVTFDASVATKQKLTVSGALTIAFSNWPASGTYGEVEIQLVNGSTNVTWPTVNWYVGDGTTSTTFSAMGVTLSAAGTNVVIVWSTDGGTTLYGKAA